MVTEDYVSFETAKLLKEKGFDSESITAYYFFMEGSEPILNRIEPQHFVNQCGGNISLVGCPTLQMAMKWLREDKKILISIFCHIDKGYWFCIQHFIDSPYKFATSESIHRKEEILGKIQYYNTYEQACEAAIRYCLENIELWKKRIRN